MVGRRTLVGSGSGSHRHRGPYRPSPGVVGGPASVRSRDRDAAVLPPKAVVSGGNLRVKNPRRACSHGEKITKVSQTPSVSAEPTRKRADPLDEAVEKHR